jgi:hypothetical protein
MIGLNQFNFAECHLRSRQADIPGRDGGRNTPIETLTASQSISSPPLFTPSKLQMSFATTYSCTVHPQMDFGVERRSIPQFFAE